MNYPLEAEAMSSEKLRGAYLSFEALGVLLKQINLLVLAPNLIFTYLSQCNNDTKNISLQLPHHFTASDDG